MSRTKGHRDDRRRDTEQREPEANREAQDFARETGYQPSVNQRRNEPLPAGRHADRGQEAVMRNEEQAGDHGAPAPSPRVRRRD